MSGRLLVNLIPTKGNRCRGAIIATGSCVFVVRIRMLVLWRCRIVGLNEKMGKYITSVFLITSSPKRSASSSPRVEIGISKCGTGRVAL